MMENKDVIFIVFMSYLMTIVEGTHHLCGKSNHNKSTGELVPHNDEIPPHTDCLWHIYPKRHEMNETFLIFEKFELKKEDECKVSEHNGPLLFGPFSGKIGAFTVLAGVLQLDVSVKTSNDNPGIARKFRASYSSNECHYKIDNQIGFMASPLYKVSNRPDKVICTWEFRKFKELTIPLIIIFDEFHLLNSTLEIKGAESENNIYNGTDIPPKITVHGGTILELILNTEIPGERFTFRYSPSGIYPNITTPGSEITTPSSEITTNTQTVITSTTPAPIIDDPRICGKKSYNDENGRIWLRETNINSFVCSWDINCKDIINATEIFMSIEEFSIADNDTLTISDSNDQILFGPYHGKRNTFSILTGILEIKLQLISKSKQERKLSISYNAKNYTSSNPPSKSNSKDENSGFSDWTLGLSIVAAFVFGIVATIAFIIIFRRYRNGREIDYTQFPDPNN